MTNDYRRGRDAICSKIESLERDSSFEKVDEETKDNAIEDVWFPELYNVQPNGNIFSHCKPSTEDTGYLWFEKTLPVEYI